MATSRYAHIRRSDTTRQRPFIDLEPVTGSLTEGTNIPPPPPEPAPAPQQTSQPASAQPQASIGRKPVPLPKSPTKEKPKVDAAAAAAAAAAALHTQGGPLRSHPVTPSDTEVVNGGPLDQSGRPIREGQQAGTARRNPNMSQYQHNSGTGFENARPPTSGTGVAGQESQRRSSFASRFFRFRSLSALRSRNASQLTLSTPMADDTEPEQQGRTRKSSDLFAGSMRGTKRPASPNPADTLDHAGAQQPGHYSLPRMVRKKSMDFFGSARRKSGFWGGPDDMTRAAMDEEAQREQMQEGAGAGAGPMAPQSRPQSRMSRMSRMETDGSGFSLRSGRRSSFGYGRRSSVQQPRESVVHEPPPRLPEVKEFAELESDDLFKNIGRE